jgi:RNA polymerase sigma-70 factor, ECF subfamily
MISRREPIRPNPESEVSPQPPPGTQATDEQLMLHYRESRAPDTFRELVRRYERELYGYLRRYLNDAGLAEDVFQRAFIQVDQKRSSFDEGGRFRPWLYRIATHSAIDLLRKTGKRETVSLDQSAGDHADGNRRLTDLLESAAPGPPAEAELREREEWVRQAVAELPEHLRSAVMLVYFQGMKYDEAAESLDIPMGTLKSRIHTALQRLTKSLNPQRAAVRARESRRRVPVAAEERKPSSLTPSSTRRPTREGVGPTPAPKSPPAEGATTPPSEPVKQMLKSMQSVQPEAPAQLVPKTCKRVRNLPPETAD